MISATIVSMFAAAPYVIAGAGALVLLIMLANWIAK